MAETFHDELALHYQTIYESFGRSLGILQDLIKNDADYASIRSGITAIIKDVEDHDSITCQVCKDYLGNERV